MGISTAPDEYQACMMKILGDFGLVILYMDDILVYLETDEDHHLSVELVLKRLCKYNVTLNGKKCHILCENVKYLGFTLSAEGIKPQEIKVKAILTLSPPSNKK